MLGRIFITISAVSQTFGSFIADFNTTHIYNPRWPPHARFHNGQTMSMSVCLGLATIYYAYRPVPKAAAVDSIFTAAIFGSVYWLTALSAILYPGTAGIDPEFGEGFPQFWPFLGLVVITWLGYWLEKRRLVGQVAVGKSS
jgi:hypothetical protein